MNIGQFLSYGNGEDCRRGQTFQEVKLKHLDSSQVELDDEEGHVIQTDTGMVPDQQQWSTGLAGTRQVLDSVYHWRDELPIAGIWLL